MLRTLIVYKGVYGSTEEIARKLGMILGPSRCCTPEEFRNEYREFEFIIMGSGVYRGKLHPEITDFIRDNPWIAEKPVALFSVSLSMEDGARALREAEELMGDPLISGCLGGRMILDELSEEDLGELRRFSALTGMPLKDTDLTSTEEVIEFGLELKDIRDSLMKDMGDEELRKYVEEFLRSHNTCTLATCHGSWPRATPIEYTYHDGCLYLISEGGEKFAGLLMNGRVSVAVYEDYTSMNNLAGMQLTGSAKIVHGRDDMAGVLALKGLGTDLIDKLPVDLNIIKVTISRVEFLYSRFRDEGFHVRQTLQFK